jgi:hypothetical protein
MAVQMVGIQGQRGSIVGAVLLVRSVTPVMKVTILVIEMLAVPIIKLLAIFVVKVLTAMPLTVSSPVAVS